MPVAWQNNKDLGDCMIELYNKGLWTDVTFRCKDHGENERIHAHKIVLAARSPVFQAMFFGPCANGKDEVQLDNADAKILDLFLRYIYSDTVELAEENASSVLEMAHFYQVSNLVQFCADYLTSITTAENACTILNLALRYEVATLRDACCTFIDENAEEILNSEEFLELSEDCLTYILKGDTFYADEYGIFIKAEEWSKRKLEVRNVEKTGPNVRKTLGGSFYYIRLPTLTYKTLMECTRKKCYFSLEDFENIVDFINEIPDSLVESNSCVARLPTEEILTINDELGENKSTNSLTTCFQISVSRDVKLKHVTLAQILFEFLIYHHDHYLDDSIETKLLKDLNIVISGRLQVTSHKMKLSEAEIDGIVTEEDTDENETGFSHKESFSNHGDDGDNDACLISEQNLQLMSTDQTQRVVVLTEPLILTKTGSPYKVTVKLGYSCESEIKMKTCSNKENIVTSKNGHVEVKNISGEFAGIKSLGFEHISNRESAK